MPLALYALTAGAFGIGVTEFADGVLRRWECCLRAGPKLWLPHCASWGPGRAPKAGRSPAARVLTALAHVNLAAFNLGDAIGAWAGGVVIDHGPGLGFVPLVAALFPAAATVIAVLAVAIASPQPALRTRLATGAKPRAD